MVDEKFVGWCIAIKKVKKFLESKPFKTWRKLPYKPFAKPINTSYSACAYRKCDKIIIYEYKYLLCVLISHSFIGESAVSITIVCTDHFLL